MDVLAADNVERDRERRDALDVDVIGLGSDVLPCILVSQPVLGPVHRRADEPARHEGEERKGGAESVRERHGAEESSGGAERIRTNVRTSDAVPTN